MAERRMFSKAIVLSDAFLDMPMSARCLYFTLGMQADDDGFVGNPKSIMRQCGATQDDLVVLIQKRYILSFDSGVIVIKHWRINNYLKSGRYKPTTYLEEKSALTTDEKGSYTECIQNVSTLDTNCIQTVSKVDTQVSIGKDSIGKDSIDNKDEDYMQKSEKLSAEQIELVKELYPDDWQERVNKYVRGDAL